MKRFHKKSIVLLAALTLLLTFTVSGTVAFLSVSSGPVTNTFTPAVLKTKIVEEFSGDEKRSIKVQNDGTIDAYVRVGVYGYWTVNDQIVAPWIPEFSAGEDWSYNSADGWYYYTLKLPPTDGIDLTSNLLGNSTITDGNPPEGYPDAQLVVTVIHQSIQTEPASAREAANWGWNPGTGN